MKNVRSAIVFSLMSLWLASPFAQAAAQSYPSRVIRMIIPFPPGGPTDVVARIMSNSVSPILGQSLIIENRPGGAGGTVGGKYVATADPDGYTLLVSQVGALTITPSLYKLDYDPLKDLTPIAIVVQSPQILVVNPQLPVHSLTELFAYARDNPSKVDFASPGIGTQPHLLGELLQIVGKIKLTHVPYRGSAPAITDLLAGQVQLMFDSPSVMLPHIEDGKLRPLAVTSETRFAQLPDLPTVSEAGYPQLTATLWTGLLAPAGTPQAIIDTLNAATNAGLKTPEAQASLKRLGVETKAVTAPQFATIMAAETQKWAKVVAQAGIKAQ